MSILSELDPIRLQLGNISFGEILRNTRDILGLKQWRLAEFLDVRPARLKHLEANIFREIPDPQLVEKFCNLFEYDFELVMHSVMTRVSDHKHAMEIQRKSPYYAKKRESA